MHYFSCIDYQIDRGRYMYAVFVACFLFILLSCVQTLAQDTVASPVTVPVSGEHSYAIPEGGLQIGDTIPDEVWEMPLQVVNYPEGKETITLSEYKNKLIILDFWGTACGACISALYKLDTLQSQLPDDLAIIPVAATQEAEPVAMVIEKRGWNLPSVVSAPELAAYFPHKMIPQYVWIKDNEVRGITESADGTIENIHKVINNADFSMQTKKDIMDYSRRVHLCEYASRVNSPIYLSSIVTERIPGIPSAYTMGPIGNLYVVNFTNALIITMYRRVLGTRNNRIIVQSDASARYDQIIRNDNMYGYQLKIPKSITTDKRRQHIINDLNTAFQLQLDSLMIEMECFVITEAVGMQQESNVISNVEVYPTGTDMLGMDRLVSLLNYSHYWTEGQAIYLNESIYAGKVKIPDYRTLQEDGKLLEAILLPYGLTIKREKRCVMMYILTDVAEGSPD